MESCLTLDSFADSGAAGAVTHTSGRRWVMLKLEEKRRELRTKPVEISQ